MPVIWPMPVMTPPPHRRPSPPLPCTGCDCLLQAREKARSVVGQRPLEGLADEALPGDAAGLGAGLERGDEGFGQAHGQAGGFRQGLEVQRAELGEVEGGEVLFEEGSALRQSLRCRYTLPNFFPYCYGPSLFKLFKVVSQQRRVSIRVDQVRIQDFF